MTIRPSDYPAMPVELFAGRNDWVMHDGKSAPVGLDPAAYVMVMYSNGAIANRVRVSSAWDVWTGGRSWWIDPGDGRLWIAAYVVI